MKYKILFSNDQEEDIIISAKNDDKLLKKIEEILIGENITIFAQENGESEKLAPSEIFAFSSENGKVFAITSDKKLQIKNRIYKLEEELPQNFIKINQSCIVNINHIEKFFSTPYGSLSVKLKNGYTDYISRRNVKKVKERLGMRK